MSIIKSYRSRNNAGKSIVFLYIVFIGYVSGVIHKLLYNLDFIVIMYMLNAVMVMIDLVLYYRNEKIQNTKMVEQ
jgi:lipopolysaccharide export LptBFGC system permease protein LptF